MCVSQVYSSCHKKIERFLLNNINEMFSLYKFGCQHWGLCVYSLLSPSMCSVYFLHHQYCGSSSTAKVLWMCQVKG